MTPMTTPISTLGFINQQLDAITSGRKLVDTYSLQMSTGKKAVDLADNPDRLQILDLRSLKTSRESYLTSITMATTTVNANKLALDHLTDLATKLLAQVTTIAGGTSTFDPAKPNFDPTQQFNQLSSYVNSVSSEVTATLNEKIGDSYLFGGSRSSLPYSTPPVVDLTNKSLVPDFSTVYTTPQVDDPLNLTPANASSSASYVAPVGPPPKYNPTTSALQNLPIYDADVNQATPAAPLQSRDKQAWLSPKVTIDEGQSVDYRFTSVDPTFQQLINGIRAARTAADNASTLSVADRNSYLQLAVSSLNKALYGDTNNPAITAPRPATLGLRGMGSKNDLTLVTLNTKQDYHNQTINLVTSKLDSLEGINDTEVAVKLSAANYQLEASYKATSSMLGLSLMNYLK